MKTAYTYHCQDCKHLWIEKQSEITKNLPRYQPCPKCQSSINIDIVNSNSSDAKKEEKEHYYW